MECLGAKAVCPVPGQFQTGANGEAAGLGQIEGPARNLDREIGGVFGGAFGDFFSVESEGFVIGRRALVKLLI